LVIEGTSQFMSLLQAGVLAVGKEAIKPPLPILLEHKKWLDSAGLGNQLWKSVA
jgi:hypothetical protein